MRRPRRRLGALLLAGALLGLGAGCTDDPPPVTPPAPETTTTPAPTTRPIVVATTEPYAQADPAAVTDAMSDSLVLNVFQRLMTVPPGHEFAKPDAARDCLYDTDLTFTCTLQEDMHFHNGHRLTSSDVKFSIERAIRLHRTGTSAWLLGSINKIETPDALTVRFLLKRPDTQLGFALASPAASIVDEELYPANRVRGPELGAVGSGPYLVGGVQGSQVRFTAFGGYQGYTPATRRSLIVHRYPTSGDLEAAMDGGEVDVVWRGLSAAARQRLGHEIGLSPERRTAGGFAPVTLPGKRVSRLVWNPHSDHRTNADLRAVVTGVLQEARTLDSIVPDGVEGHTTSFAVGEAGGANVTWSKPIALTLAYDPASPDAADRADQIARRLEAAGRLHVALIADAHTEDADLTLDDVPAWTWTGSAWAQAYVEHPAIGSTQRIADLVAQYGRETEPERAQIVLTEIQKQAAADQVVVPLTQDDEVLFLNRGVTLPETGYGPGWQLGLWGFDRG